MIELIEIRPDAEVVKVYHTHDVTHDGQAHKIYKEEHYYTIHNEVSHADGRVRVRGFFPAGAEIHVDTDHADIKTITITAEGEGLNANDAAAKIAAAIMEHAEAEDDLHALEETEDAVTATVATVGINITGVALLNEQHPPLPDEVKVLLNHHATR